MGELEKYLDQQLARGRSFFSTTTAIADLGHSPRALREAVARLAAKGKVVSPRRGFYLILRPEDRPLGAPDPARWIDPLMSYLRLDYRIALLRAAAFHGSSHQAAMVFQVIAPRQLPAIHLGRQRLEFVYQSPDAFAVTNRQKWLDRLKTETGYAKVAGVELTLLDMCRYFHRASGLNGAAQAVHDLGMKARTRILSQAAAGYETSAVRRLGWLLEHFGNSRQAKALLPYARKAKSFRLLDPSARSVISPREKANGRNHDWMLDINVSIEIDS